MSEIDQEVRRRRAAGEFPPSFERRLDLLFSRFAPVGTKEGYFEEALNLADRAAYVDIDVPLRSNIAGVALLKRTLRKLMAWYLNYVVQQLVRFSSATMRVLHMFDDRLGELEEEARARRPHPLREDDRLTPEELFTAVEPLPAQAGWSPPDPGAEVGEWASLIRTVLGPSRGRVLHAECASGGLVAALAADGIDAYGVDPRAALLDLPSALGLDVRREDVLEHLRAVAVGSLAGLVLSGCVDYLSVREQRALADLAFDRLAPGGLVVIIGIMPNAWAHSTAVVEVDLAPGRPLHPETWCHLLERRGFDDIEAHRGAEEPRLGIVQGAEPEIGVLNANLGLIDRVLFGPASFAVVGVRRRP
ncbi:MAG: hypothetical protein DLM54_07460 [Acidimicrobiales bacterium]|nr:MAG: hypothetical protein DLM54_07460 [Acidimicrobiales bacterium]